MTSKKTASRTRTKGSSQNKPGRGAKTRATDGRGRKIDWEAIEREYRAGIKSQAQLAREHKISEASISARAKREGWKRDLTAAIRKAAELANLQANVERTEAAKKPGQELFEQFAGEGEVKPSTPAELDAAMVDKYSGLIAEILGEHQSLARRLRGATKGLVAQIEAALEAIEPAIDELVCIRETAIAEQKTRKKLRKHERALKPYTRAELLQKRLALLNQIVMLKQRTVQPLDRLIQLERQSYGLQDGDGHAVDDLNYDTLLRELHGV